MHDSEAFIYGPEELWIIMEQIRKLIADADMVLIGVGDEFTRRKASKEDILLAYEKVAELIKGKPWFLVTLNTDDLVYEAGFHEFFVAAPCGSEKSGNVITSDDYDESQYLPQWQFYRNWLTSTIGKKLCILELGVGMSYPSVVRMPFERTVQFNQKAKMIRIHSKLAFVPEDISDRSYCIGELPVDFLIKQ